MVTEDNFWRGRRILVTGHTGFKGAWLCAWLSKLGARVFGLSLAEDHQSLARVANTRSLFEGEYLGDIRSFDQVRRFCLETQPQVVFHLAAQPLVNVGVSNPIDTYSINIFGTINLLESLFNLANLEAIVVVTSDKCYEPSEDPVLRFSEGSSLGGNDPYSVSKACQDLISTSYHRTFFSKSGIPIATARSGNVIGGGDWTVGRILPDYIMSYYASRRLEIRQPQAIRPWQHVLEPLSGYIELGKRLCINGSHLSGAWNFGPDADSEITVMEMLKILSRKCPGVTIIDSADEKYKETQILRLDSAKSKSILNWYPRWSVEEAIEKTICWFQSWKDGDNMLSVTMEQIYQYEVSPSRGAK